MRVTYLWLWHKERTESLAVDSRIKNIPSMHPESKSISSAVSLEMAPNWKEEASSRQRISLDILPSDVVWIREPGMQSISIFDVRQRTWKRNQGTRVTKRPSVKIKIHKMLIERLVRRNKMTVSKELFSLSRHLHKKSQGAFFFFRGIPFLFLFPVSSKSTYFGRESCWFFASLFDFLCYPPSHISCL